jgi:hypothetical protein
MKISGTRRIAFALSSLVVVALLITLSFLLAPGLSPGEPPPTSQATLGPCPTVNVGLWATNDYSAHVGPVASVAVPLIAGTPPTLSPNVRATLDAVGTRRAERRETAIWVRAGTATAVARAYTPCAPATQNGTVMAIPGTVSVAVTAPAVYSTLYVVTVEGTVRFVRTPPPPPAATSTPQR